jgi:predicted O-methyltransferase YrrM
MRNKSPFIPDGLWGYMVENWLQEPEVLARLREETAAMPESGLQISADQGQLMTVLTRVAGVRKAIEVGVFTGYSSTCVALGLPDDGQLVAFDISEPFTNVAKRYWREAGVEDKIKLVLGPGEARLRDLLAERGPGAFDAAFIDADKPNYPVYYELCLDLLKPNGFILVDNVFWGGKVGDPADTSEETERIRKFNAALHQDERIDLAIIPIGDGLTLARKK